MNELWSGYDGGVMIDALGYYFSTFQPSKPGRLCRGQERWISSWEEADPFPIYRMFLSGARFTDDSARDALRGVHYAGLSLQRLLDALLPEAHWMVYREEDVPGESPFRASAELYVRPRQMGLRQEWCERWSIEGCSSESLAAWIEFDRIDVILSMPPEGELPEEELENSLFLLTGQGQEREGVQERYQPHGITSLLSLGVDCVLCLHRDRHGPALAIYSRRSLEDRLEALRELVSSTQTLLVPFSTPPVLARWDRALHEYRKLWLLETDDPFPVPTAPRGSSPWSASAARKGPPPESSEEPLGTSEDLENSPEAAADSGPEPEAALTPEPSAPQAESPAVDSALAGGDDQG